MRVCFLEDRPEDFEPLTLTRATFDLWCGARTLREKWLAALQPTSYGAVVRPPLEALYRAREPDFNVNSWDWLRAEPTLLVNAAWLPSVWPGPFSAEEIGLLGDRIVYAWLMPERLQELTQHDAAECLHRWRLALPNRVCSGRLLERLWDLVEHNGAEIVRDFAGWDAQCGPTWTEAPIHLVGPRDRLWIDPSARIDPLVTADTSAGPVILDHHVIAAPFTRLEGPCYIGPGTHLNGANIRAGATIGPQCRIGGEVEASIIQGFTNKAHDGFLGHSYLGEWVNLAAGTQTSDLRNDYGEVTMIHAGRKVPTAQTKVGSFIGDHTKTGLGTLLNTGSIVGTFCNLLPAGPYAPRVVPSFSNWYNGVLDEGFALEQLLTTARRVMQRRGQTLSAEHEQLYRQLWSDTSVERRREMQRTLRRGA